MIRRIFILTLILFATSSKAKELSPRVLNNTEKYYFDQIEKSNYSAQALRDYACFYFSYTDNYLKAEQYYKYSLRVDSTIYATHGEYAQLLMYLGRMDEAEQNFRKELELFPDSTRFLPDFARFLYRERKNYSVAEKYFKRALKTETENVYYVQEYAIFLEYCQRYDEAKDWYAFLIERDVKDEYLLSEYANLLYNIKGHNDESEELFEEFWDLEPTYVYGLTKYAEYLKGSGEDFDEVDERIKELKPEEYKLPIDIINYCLYLCNVTEDYEYARHVYERGIERFPENAYMKTNYAFLLANYFNDLSGADSWFLKAIETDKENSYTQLWYANYLYHFLNKPKKAHQYYKKAFRIAPDDSEVLYYYAEFLKATGENPAKASEILKKILAQSPGNYDALRSFVSSGIGAIRIPMTEFRFEETSFIDDYYNRLFLTVEKAYKASPYNGDIITIYGLSFLTMKNDTAQANYYLKKAAETYPFTSDKYAVYASFLYRTERDNELAEEYFEKAFDLEEPTAKLYKYYAQYCEEVLKDTAKSLEMYQKLSSIDQNYGLSLISELKLKLEENDIEEAGKIVDRLLLIAPDQPEPISACAKYLALYREDSTKAGKYFDKSISHSLLSINVMVQYAWFSANFRHNLATAEKYCDKALELDPKDHSASVLKSYILLRQSDFAKARKVLKGAGVRIGNNKDSSNDLIAQFLLYAHYKINRKYEAKVMDKLLDEKITAPGWDLMSNIEIAIEQGHPDIDKLREYARRISGK